MSNITGAGTGYRQADKNRFFSMKGNKRPQNKKNSMIWRLVEKEAVVLAGELVRGIGMVVQVSHTWRKAEKV